MNEKDLKIIFYGTGEFALGILKSVIIDYNVIAVVTSQDSYKGHSKIKLQSPVKSYAIENNLKVLQPIDLNSNEFLGEIKQLNPNLQIIAEFKFLPKQIWQYPKYGTFNIHASLLPDYRGAAPINWAIINGETKTGVTSFFLNETIDTGNIICQLPCLIKENDTFDSIYEILTHIGSLVTYFTLEKIINTDGKPKLIKQDNSKFIHKAPKIQKGECIIDWNKPAKEVHNYIRGLSSYPGAIGTVIYNDKEYKIKIYKTLLKKAPVPNYNPGTLIISGDNKSLTVVCGDGIRLEILELQLPGKSKITAIDFINSIKNK